MGSSGRLTGKKVNQRKQKDISVVIFKERILQMIEGNTDEIEILVFTNTNQGLTT